jgi:hypothetical protein
MQDATKMKPKDSHGDLFSENGLNEHKQKYGMLYSFWVNVRDGEHGYSHFELVRAKTQGEADARARKYARTFLGCRMKPCEWAHDGKGKELFPIAWEPKGGEGEYRIVEMEGTDPITPEKVISTLLRAD